ncbi:MAG: GvpL/GvpF family gas vesicle protein [Desulfobacter sp.]
MPVKKQRRGMLYLYAVVNGKGKNSYGPIGIAGKEVYTVGDNGLAAVVSRLKTAQIRPQRKHMAAHHQVLTTLMADQTPMPVSFGIVAKGPGAVKRVLADEQDALEQAYDRVRDRVEMVARVRLDTSNVFEYFVGCRPELAAERDRVYADGEPARGDKLELGRLFDTILSQTRDQAAERVEQALSGASAEILGNTCRDERDIVDLSCLVDRGGEAAFDAAVMAAAKGFDDNFQFEVKGPWVPHSFVDLELDI